MIKKYLKPGHLSCAYRNLLLALSSPCTVFHVSIAIAPEDFCKSLTRKSVCREVINENVHLKPPWKTKNQKTSTKLRCQMQKSVSKSQNWFPTSSTAAHGRRKSAFPARMFLCCLKFYFHATVNRASLYNCAQELHRYIKVVACTTG